MNVFLLLCFRNVFYSSIDKSPLESLIDSVDIPFLSPLWATYIFFLCFQYQKPAEVLKMEKAIFEELKKVKTIRDEDLPGDCKQSWSGTKILITKLYRIDIKGLCEEWRMFGYKIQDGSTSPCPTILFTLLCIAYLDWWRDCRMFCLNMQSSSIFPAGDWTLSWLNEGNRTKIEIWKILSCWHSRHKRPSLNFLCYWAKVVHVSFGPLSFFPERYGRVKKLFAVIFSQPSFAHFAAMSYECCTSTKTISPPTKVM